MKRILLLTFILVGLLSGCKPASQTTPPGETSLPTLDVTIASTVTQPLPSATPAAATATEAPTLPPAETLTPTLAPTRIPPAISSANGRNLAYTGRLGSGAVVTVALAPDASQVAVLTTTSLLSFDIATGDLSWQVSTDRVYREAVFSEDGTQIVTATRGGSVQRWGAATGEKLPGALPIIPNTRHVALSGNGAVLAVMDNFDQTFLWDTNTTQQLQFNNGFAFPGGALEVAASPDGKLFLNTGIDSQVNYQIRLWELSTGRFLVGLQGLPGEVSSLRFSPDSQYVAALGTKVSGGLHGMQYLYLWRASDGALLDTVDLSLDTSTYAFLADGSTVLAGTAAGQVMFINFRFSDQYSYGFIQDAVFAHESAVVGLSSSADGLKYASAAADGSVKVWDTATGEEIFTTQLADLSLTTIHDEWKYEDLAVFDRQHQTGMSVSPTNQLLARTAADLHAVDLIDLLSGGTVHSLKIETPAYYSAPVFAPDGKTVAAVFDNTHIIFWDVETGFDVLRLTTPHIHPITRLEYAASGSQIASLGEGELFVWDLETMRQQHALTAFHTFTYSADGQTIFTDTHDVGINLVDAQTGRKITWIETEKVNDLAVSPDSKYAAIAGYRSPVRYQQENLVYFIDLLDNSRIRTIELSGYPAEVTNVAYSPDGSVLVSIDLYGDIYVWAAAGGNLLQHFEEQVAMPGQIRFSSDGNTLMILGADNSVQYYQVLE